MTCDLFIAFYQFSEQKFIAQESLTLSLRSNCFLPNTWLLTAEWVLTNKLFLAAGIHSPSQNFSFAMNKSQLINYFTLQDTERLSVRGERLITEK